MDINHTLALPSRTGVPLLAARTVAGQCLCASVVKDLRVLRVSAVKQIAS